MMLHEDSWNLWLLWNSLSSNWKERERGVNHSIFLLICTNCNINKFSFFPSASSIFHTHSVWFSVEWKHCFFVDLCFMVRERARKCSGYRLYYQNVQLDFSLLWCQSNNSISNETHEFLPSFIFCCSHAAISSSHVHLCMCECTIVVFHFTRSLETICDLLWLEEKKTWFIVFDW